jgi:Protein of unknown function (DUF1552)
MNPKTWALSRRTFLRGVGAAIALPWLEGMSFGAEAVKPPVRLACIYFPNGAWMEGWVPRETGADYPLPFSLTPIEPFKKDVLVVSGLDKATSHDGDGHYAKTANFLTGLHVEKTSGKNINVGGISLDQLCAEKLGDRTPLPSLELGIDPVISGIDSNVGYTRLYGSHVSWRSATVPVAKEINPRLVFDRLFGSKDGKGARQRDDDRSLLDLTLEDARGLRKQLGRDDQFKLDEYLDSIRAVERRIEFAAKPDPRPAHPDATASDAPAGIPKDYPEHAKLMLDLLVLAFRTDSTRVVSFMMANDVSGKNFSFVEGVHAGHHDTSHHQNEKDKIEQYRRIVRWHVEQFAYLLGKLRDAKEGERTLLEQALVLFGSSISDGNSHDPSNLPILVGGGAGGGWETGRHLACKKNTPLCNLYVSLLERMGTPVERFGDSSGALPGS